MNILLKDLRDYLNKMAIEDPHSLYKPFVVHDMWSGENHQVLYIDEGQNPTELSINTGPPSELKDE